MPLLGFTSLQSGQPGSREIELTPGLRRLFAAAATGRYVFHGSGRRGLKQFRLQPDGMEPMVLARRIHFKPLIHATASPFLSATVAASRVGDLPGFQWCTHPMKPDAGDGDRIAATLFHRDGPTLERFRSAASGDIESTATVYGFLREQFRSDGPIWGDYLTDGDIDVTEVFPLHAADIRALAEAIGLDSLHAASGHAERAARSLDGFSGSGMCALGGHFQYRTGSDGMLPWRPLTDDDREFASKFLEAQRATLPGEHWWGTSSPAFSESGASRLMAI